MNFIDSRERYDDHLVRRDEEEMDPDAFADAAISEPTTIGWVVLEFVFDRENRVLLINQDGMDGWTKPGGAAEPGETLPYAVIREVREETGVESTVVRPHAISEFRFTNSRTGETEGWKFASYELEAVMTEFDDSLGIDGEKIYEARWFEDLSDDVYHPELTEAVYQRCAGNRAPR